MPTRRPKVPKAGSAPDGSDTGGRAGRSEARPVRRRNTAADPDVISATKPVEGTVGTGSRPSKESAKTAAAKTASPKTAAPKTGTKPAKAKAGKPEAGGSTDSAGRGKAAAAAGRLRRRSRILAEGSAAGLSAEETADDLRPVPAKAFSGRLLVLAMVTVVVTVLLAPSVNTYLHQRSDIAAMEAEIAEQKETSRTLESQLQRWEDPNYIKQQARERIFLVLPGETRYLVKGEHGVENVELQAQEKDEDLQWVDALWDSVKRSANAP
ncbi:cell division protein FtsB [Arthrobacter sp. UYP6]|uniref:FtsB family cell division protein n=1 Tax=Arthrobacter sp. UYP6 TaxID=1756378 RepID=UPI00339A05F1